MPVRCVVVGVSGGAPTGAELADLRAAVGEAVLVLVALDPSPPVEVLPDGVRVLEPARIGLAAADPALLAVAAAAAGCWPREVLVAAEPSSPLVVAADAVGARVAPLPPLGHHPREEDLRQAVRDAEAADAEARAEVGVGPHPEPWPHDERLDPALLRDGDRRNVVDRYRYWREDAIVADLDRRRRPVHVAIENWQHDLNIGTVVRNANAANVAGVHIVGRRRWNRRGAMATDRYLTVHHHPDVAALAAWAGARELPLVGVDNVPGAVPVDDADLPAAAVLLFGQEGPGLSTEALAACELVCDIPMAGSTRSLNAGVASGIVLHAWTRRHPGP